MLEKIPAILDTSNDFHLLKRNITFLSFLVIGSIGLGKTQPAISTLNSNFYLILKELWPFLSGFLAFILLYLQLSFIALCSITLHAYKIRHNELEKKEAQSDYENNPAKFYQDQCVQEQDKKLNAIEQSIKKIQAQKNSLTSNTDFNLLYEKIENDEVESLDHATLKALSEHLRNEKTILNKEKELLKLHGTTFKKQATALQKILEIELESKTQRLQKELVQSQKGKLIIDTFCSLGISLVAFFLAYDNLLLFFRIVLQ